MLSALVYLEEKEVAHLDIKPSNILKSFDGDYRLADFGLSRNMFYNTVLIT